MPTTLGMLSVETTPDNRVRKLYLPGVAPLAVKPPAPGTLAWETFTQLQAWIDGRLRHFDLPLALEHLTPFQRDVLDKISAIPYGEVRRYNELGPARAVGHVCAMNPLPIIIPCHRVLPKSGKTGCYQGGAHLKQHLLSIESSARHQYDLF